MLDEVKNKFLEHLKSQNKASATILAYGKDIEQLIVVLKNLGKSDFTQVVKEDLDVFLKKLRDDGFTPKTVSRKINSLKTFYRFLKGQGIVSVNPAAELTHPKYELKTPRILSKMEYRALRDVSRNDPRTYAVVELFLQTGLRISEVSQLKFENMKEKKLLLDKREIPLNSSVFKAVQDYLTIRPKNANIHVFITKTGNPLLIRNIRTAIDRVLKAAGVENAKVNDLRATFIAHQLSSGVPLDYVSKLVGHKRLSTTERYLKLVNEKGKKGAKLVEL